jgi:hypothetical protein
MLGAQAPVGLDTQGTFVSLLALERLSLPQRGHRAGDAALVRARADLRYGEVGRQLLDELVEVRFLELERRQIHHACGVAAEALPAARTLRRRFGRQLDLSLLRPGRLSLLRPGSAAVFVLHGCSSLRATRRLRVALRRPCAIAAESDRRGPRAVWRPLDESRFTTWLYRAKTSDARAWS